jgi:putative membrane protein
LSVEPAAEHGELANRLKTLQGEDFDREFIAAMVADHQKDVAKFEKQADSTENDVAGFARETLPVLESHLQIATSIESELR